MRERQRNQEMTQKKKRRSLKFSIMQISVIPVLVLGIILTIYAQNSVHVGMRYEVEENLSGLAHNLISIYNLIDAGEFSYENGVLLKGETDITSDYRILDDMKNDTGADMTICIGNERRLTTMVDQKGDRLIGTEVPVDVQEAVLEKGEEYFSTNIGINGEEYFGYYVPVRNDEGDVIGMSFAGKSVNMINESINSMVRVNVLICILIILLVGAICHILTQNMVNLIQEIKHFLGALARGEFGNKIPAEVMKRRDELAEIGEDAQIVSQSLEKMVMRDPLTWLLNRRACLQQAGNRQPEEAFGIALGDIDFFKQINDQYGHAKGDEVLCFVAEVMQRGIGDSGFVSRWGGEEFLLAMEGEVTVLYSALRRIEKEITTKEFECQGEKFRTSVTFGIVTWRETESFEHAVNRADKLMYYGKEHGRKQIVPEEGIAMEPDKNMPDNVS